LILLDTFVATVALTALTLSALVAERRKVQLALESSRNELERRVIERTEALAIANTELMQRNEEVQGFVYIVSHDLRAPLVNLQGFSLELSRSCAELEQRLVQSELSPDRLAPMQRILSDEIASALRFISASTKKFERLIEALLALSRYGRQSLAIECVDVRTLINSTLDSLRSSIVDTRTEFMLKELPPVRGDVTALGQVFANLIVNALKYHHPGRSPRIEIGGQLEGDRVRYWVADNGAGIPGAVQHRVFQVFQRFHPERVGGEGMGLAIAKRVVERHGGTITFESEEGTGTKFILMLPAAVAREEAA
jgi:signal transduction histidine kinase